jgi:uncharacterized cupin superfamily protein
VRVINAVSCEPDEVFGRGRFHADIFDLTERLGASVIGATVFEMRAGEKPGELVAFCSGPAGAHTTHGPGRVVVFSAGKRGWGEAFVSVYPDSDKIAAAGPIIFRRADAIDAWFSDGDEAPAAVDHQAPAAGPGSPAINLMTTPLESPSSHPGESVRQAMLGARLGAQTWTAAVYQLAPGEATAPYHYKWCREEWALVLSGAPTLRHADGQTRLSAGDICCFPQGPSGAHRLGNDSEQPARLVVFSTSTDRPMSAVYPDEGTVLIYVSRQKRFLFRHEDRIEDYWDGEPGAT